MLRRKPLISGDLLTNKEKLVLEERTALLINLAGVTAQKTLAAFDQGVSTRRFYKILANAIYDWHWLSFNHKDVFVFNGIGNLVWTPHRFGSLGQVKPAIEYEGEDIKLHHGQFANMADLFKSKIYNSYGYRGTTGTLGQHYFLFPAFISYDALTKSRVEPQEQHFWEELVKIYSSLSDSSLDAMASCRTKTAGFHSLWIQFVMWKRYMGTAIDMLNTQNPMSYDSDTRQRLMENIESARACIRQIFLKIKYQSNIQEHIDGVKKSATYTELSSYLPCVDELEPSVVNKYEIFVEFSTALETLHDICREFQIHQGLDKQEHNVSLTVLESKLQDIGLSLKLSSDLVDTIKWCNLFLQKDTRKEIAQRIMILIETSFGVFEEKLGLKFERPSGHYGKFITQYYPLPTEHFVQGN